MKNVFALACAGTAAFALAACDPEINVREKWGRSIANFGLRGVYPMLEDLAPGDIYIYVPNACGDYITRLSEMRRVGSLPGWETQQAMEQYYGSRPHFPRTKPPASQDSASPKTTERYPAGRFTLTGEGAVKANVEASPAGAMVTKSEATTGGANSAPAPQDSPEATAADPIFSSSPRGFTRLRMAALPTIALYNSVGGTAGGAWNWISGAIGGQDARKVRVSATRVEMAEIPSIAFLDIVSNFMSSPAWAQFVERANGVADQLRYEIASDPKCPRVSTEQTRLMFVSTVYYTRTLVYEYADDGAFAATLAATASAAQGAATPATPFNPPSLASTSPSNPAQTSAQALLVGLAQMSGGPGAGFNFALGYSGNIELSQTWARPMAIATQHSFFYYLPLRASERAKDESKSKSGSQAGGTEGEAAPHPDHARPAGPALPRSAAIDSKPATPATPAPPTALSPQAPPAVPAPHPGPNRPSDFNVAR